MAKHMKLSLLVGLLASMALLLEQAAKPNEPVSNRQLSDSPSPNYRPPDYFPAMLPPRYPEWYSRPDFYPSYPPPMYPGYYPQVPNERRLDESQKVDKQPEKKAETKPVKATKPLKKNKSLDLKDATPRGLELTETLDKSTDSKKTRELRQLSPQQKALAHLLKPFVKYLRHHSSSTLDDFHAELKRQFSNDNGFFERNFWPIVTSNYNPARTRKLDIRKLERDIAKQIFKVDARAMPTAIVRSATPAKQSSKLVSPSELSNTIHQLSLERESSHDSSDSLNGFQVRADFLEKYSLLQALYQTENKLYKNPASKETIVQSLTGFQIHNYKEFKTKTHDTLEYFGSFLAQFKVHRKSVMNQEFVHAMDSARYMVKSIRNKILGPFFVKFAVIYAQMHIQRNNPTIHQRQTLNLEIARLIAEVGLPSYLSSVYKVIHQISSFRKMQPVELTQAPSSYSIFRQTFENQIHSGTFRFLLDHYFTSVSDKVLNIENLIFMDDSSLLSSVRFDFRELLIEFVSKFSLKSFTEFNVVLNTVSGQIETVMRRAPTTPTKSYFHQFITVYSKIAFQVIGHYFYLTKQAENFSVYAQEHDIPRQFYPENYATLVHSVHDPHHVGSALATVADAGNKSVVHKSTDADIQRIVFELSQYLDNPNGVIFNSEAERQSVLNVINSILKKANSGVLSKKSYIMVNKLREEITRTQNLQGPQSVQPISAVKAPSIDLPAELERFRVRLHAIRPLKTVLKSSFKISIRFLEDAAVLTKFLITLFQLSTQSENGLLLALTEPFLESHIISPDIDADLEQLYMASRTYTDHYEAVFALGETDKAKQLWKVLMRYYSADCYIALYKQLTLRIVMMAAEPKFQEHRFSRVKKITINLLLFLSKRQTFDLKKDCEQASILITRKRFVSDLILKRTFLLNSFKKVFLHIRKPEIGKIPPPPVITNEMTPAVKAQIIKNYYEQLKASQKNRKYRDFFAEYFPDLNSGGKRVGGDPPSDGGYPPIIRTDGPPVKTKAGPPGDIGPPGEGNPPGDDKPPTITEVPPSIRTIIPPPSTLEIIKEIERERTHPGTTKIIEKIIEKREVIHEKEPGTTNTIEKEIHHYHDSPDKPGTDKEPEKEKKEIIKVERTPANRYGAILLLQTYLGMYGAPVAFPPGFEWEKIDNKMNDGDWGFLIDLLNKYGKDVRNVGHEKSIDNILKLREIITKINPPTPQKEKEPCPPSGTQEKSEEAKLKYAASMMDAFYQSFAHRNDIHGHHKRIKFKVSPSLLNYFAKLNAQHPNEQPAEIIARHPRVFSKIQKSVFFFKPFTPGTNIPPPSDGKVPPSEEQFNRFAQKALQAYFRERIKSGSINPQLLAKRLFKNPPPDLKDYLKVLYQRPDCPPPSKLPPPEITKITEVLKHDEFKFYNRVIKHFFKTTDYLKFNGDAKKINARLFFKYLPATKRQFVHRVYNRFGAAPKFIKKGPVASMHGLIQRVQYKYQAKCKANCKSQCYKIVNGQQIELTEEDKKKWGINFTCMQNSDILKLFDINGNFVASAEQALYGCGCQCGGGKGGVQINEKPVLNFNINFETEQEARDFEEFLRNSDFLTKIKDSSVINLEKLKRKYQASKLRGVYDLDMIHKSYVGGKFDADGFDTSGTGDPEQQYQNIDYNTPQTVGLPQYDDSGQKIIRGQRFRLNGQLQNPSNGAVHMPFMFGFSPTGEVTKLRKIPGKFGKADEYDFEDELQAAGDKRTGQEFTLYQRKGSPSVITQDHTYPVYFPVKETVVGEQLSPNELIRGQRLQETLKTRYPLTANNYPYKSYSSPYNIGKPVGVFSAGVEQNKRLI